MCTARTLALLAGVVAAGVMLAQPPGPGVSTLPTAAAAVLLTELPPHGGVSGGGGGDPRAAKEVQVEIAPGVKMAFCWVPPGKATLGSSPPERGLSNAVPEHPYTAKGFWLAKYEITQEQWEAVMGSNPSNFDGVRDNRAKGMDASRFPVDQVSPDDCQRFLKRLNDRGGAAKVFGKAGKFVLPTEDEWEYAARGGKGNKQPFYWGNELNGTQANCDGTAPWGLGSTPPPGPYLQRTTTVGSYAKVAPHPWGLCDMHGNVMEWAEGTAAAAGGAAPGYGICGGSWISNAEWCRASRRLREATGGRSDYTGARVCYRPD